MDGWSLSTPIVRRSTVELAPTHSCSDSAPIMSSLRVAVHMWDDVKAALRSLRGAAWYLSAGLNAFLFGLQSNDLRAFAVAAITLSLAGLAAAVVPARRAAGVDPIV